MLTPAKLQHLNGPLPQHPKLLFRYGTEQIGLRRVPVPSRIFSGKRAQGATFDGNSIVDVASQSFSRGTCGMEKSSDRANFRQVQLREYS
jgi:hypothetical protein